LCGCRKSASRLSYTTETSATIIKIEPRAAKGGHGGAAMSLTHQEIEELASKVGNPYWQIAYHDAQDLVFGLSPEDKADVLARADEYRVANLERREVTPPEAAILPFRKVGPADSAEGSS
jgi:hypothetical protein